MSNWYQSNILNQGGTPAVLTGNLADIPAAGYVGRLFVSKDTFAWYRDNGTTWDLIGGPGTGTITGSGAANQVAYFTASGIIASSANLQFNGTVLTVTNDMVVNGLTIGKGNNAGTTNVAFGSNALKANTTGSVNVGIGYLALEKNTTGNSNVAIGGSALFSNTTGSNNVAIGGNGALLGNVSGSSNIAIGDGTLLDNTGNQNIAVGVNSLVSNRTGANNIAIGSSCLSNAELPSNNIGIGTQAGQWIETGGDNICIGLSAGSPTGLFFSNSTNNGIYIGNLSQSSLNTNSNEIVIGNNAVGNGSNTITIGHTTNLNAYIRGALNISTAVVTKTASGTALSIVDSANGNALNINKTGSGFAINVAAGVSNFQGVVATTGSFTGLLNTTLGEGLIVGGNSFAFAPSSTRGAAHIVGSTDRIMSFGANGLSDLYIFSSNTISQINSTPDLDFAVGGASRIRASASTGNILINTTVDNLVDKLYVNGSAFINGGVTSGSYYCNGALAVGNSNLTAATAYIQSNSGTIPVLRVQTTSTENIIEGRNNLGQIVFAAYNNGNIINAGSIETGAPTTGTAAPWKLGSLIVIPGTGLCNNTYVEAEINGTFVKLATIP